MCAAWLESVWAWSKVSTTRVTQNNNKTISNLQRQLGLCHSRLAAARSGANENILTCGGTSSSIILKLPRGNAVHESQCYHVAFQICDGEVSVLLLPNKLSVDQS